MNKPNIKSPDLESIARNYTSRHLEIPPTPADTLAVLRQAAEDQKARSAVRPPPLFFRRLVALAACATLLIAAWQFYPEVKKGNAAPVALRADLALDLADWDLEFDAIYADLNESLESITTESDPL